MLRCFIFLILSHLFLALHAQDDSIIFLKGQLIDSATLLPVAFAHIRLRESLSVSNQHGYFTIKYSKDELNAEVIISCVGYKTINSTVASIRNFPKVKIVPDIIVLNEVIVSELSPQSIFKKAEKNGYKNYRTSMYSANYTVDQLVFYENSDSLLAVSKDSGTLLNRGLDTTGIYPHFNNLNREISAHFLEYDTLPNQLTPLTKHKNTVSPELLYSYDPVRVGILKQFHSVPAIFSKGFYDNTEQQILSTVNLGEEEYYLMAVYPRTAENGTNNLMQESITQYKKKIRELAIKSGRPLSENSLDSIFSVRGKSLALSYYIMGFFLVNVKNFGISHALIKVNTFDTSGKVYAKLHVAASYIESGKSYYLESLDVLMKRSSPSYYDADKTLYYLLSLKLSDFETKKVRRSITKISKIGVSHRVSSELLNQFKLENVRQFLMPVKECVSCDINPLKYFNRSFPNR